METFGHLQSQTYATSMERCLELLAENPRIGRLAPYLGSRFEGMNMSVTSFYSKRQSSAFLCWRSCTRGCCFD
ncbi:hypothetical protein [Rhizobium halophilum]|uniref:hypothetical protein n=1 Tax=Rhizobium halophilum TaxID=2846852 RepID=UPI001EFCF18D|nr:hypothetical protein [Rhizobium halophilum]MCF6367822.1 hypothetical protein [Rhizobium halophilum]